jgi:hypothetical protein
LGAELIDTYIAVRISNLIGKIFIKEQSILARPRNYVRTQHHNTFMYYFHGGNVMKYLRHLYYNVDNVDTRYVPQASTHQSITDFQTDFFYDARLRRIYIKT